MLPGREVPVNLGSQRRVMVVDDEADMRLTLKLALELAGYEVESAANGAEALALQRNRPVDVLITKIVVVSGGAAVSKRDYLSDAELIGVDATLQKPFDMDRLLTTLRTLAP